MKKVVIHQPLFFPWIGMFEQIRLADIYMHYDDAAISLSGGLINRIKIKTVNGSVWITVPIFRKGEQLISEVKIDNVKKWKDKHIKSLEQNYSRAPYVNDMLEIVKDVYSKDINRLMDLNIYAIEKVLSYFNLKSEIMMTSDLNINSKSSEKVLDLVKAVRGNTYITGDGARNYLKHDLFEKHEIKVKYMDYKRLSYPQLYGEFDPHVSVLDLIANMGTEGSKYICSGSIYWKDYMGLN